MGGVWKHLPLSTLSNVANGLPSMMRMTQSQATAQCMGKEQIIESVSYVDLRGKIVTVLGKLRNSLAASVRYASRASRWHAKLLGLEGLSSRKRLSCTKGRRARLARRRKNRPG